jgi:predicted dehydrogenase
MALTVGLAGAGPWAAAVHAPTFATGPETVLGGVWSRRPESAQPIAEAHGVPVFADFDALVAACDAVALAVPPSVQPDLAVRAARAGRPLLLEKPLADTVAGAEAIAAAVAEAGVASVMLLTYRFAAPVREFLARAATFTAHGGRAAFVSGAFLAESPYAHGWRIERGCVLDVGPHILDLVDAALGPIVAVEARGDAREWVSIVCEHATGSFSDVAISCSTGIMPSRTEVELFGRTGSVAVDARADDRAAMWARLRREFAEAVATGRPHPCDAARGLQVQRIVDAVETSLRTSSPSRVPSGG